MHPGPPTVAGGQDRVRPGRRRAPRGASGPGFVVVLPPPLLGRGPVQVPGGAGAGASDALSTERSYVARTLPRVWPEGSRMQWSTAGSRRSADRLDRGGGRRGRRRVRGQGHRRAPEGAGMTVDTPRRLEVVGGRPGETTVKRAGLVLPLALLAAAALLWLMSLSSVGMGEVSDIGLISALPPTFFAAIVLLTAGFFLELRRTAPRQAILWVHLGLAVVFLQGVVSVVEGAPGSRPRGSTPGSPTRSPTTTRRCPCSTPGSAGPGSSPWPP